LEQFLQGRDQLTPNRICDVDYVALRRDPIAAVRRIYDHFGWSLSQEAERRMRAVLTSQPREQYGLHRYNLAQFGLQGTETTEAFAVYCERFDLSEQRASRKSECAAGLALEQGKVQRHRSVT
jgi:hypothetical protein